jgi:hypothetical protein
VIAVEVHQDRAFSSDVSFDLELKATLAPQQLKALSRKPITDLGSGGAAPSSSGPASTGVLEKSDEFEFG